jgi:hypothetical protein
MKMLLVIMVEGVHFEGRLLLRWRKGLICMAHI